MNKDNTIPSSLSKEEIEKMKKRVEEIYEANRPKFHYWGTLKEMCIATAIEYAKEYSRPSSLPPTKEIKKLWNKHMDITYSAETGKKFHSPIMFFTGFKNAMEEYAAQQLQSPGTSDAVEETKKALVSIYMELKTELKRQSEQKDFETLRLIGYQDCTFDFIQSAKQLTGIDVKDEAMATGFLQSGDIVEHR